MARPADWGKETKSRTAKIRGKLVLPANPVTQQNEGNDGGQLSKYQNKHCQRSETNKPTTGSRKKVEGKTWKGSQTPVRKGRGWVP